MLMKKELFMAVFNYFPFPTAGDFSNFDNKYFEEKKT